MTTVKADAPAVVLALAITNEIKKQVSRETCFFI